MGIDPVKQVILMLYDYLYHKGMRIEKEYFDEVDRYYTQVNRYRHRLIDRDNMLRLIELETSFKTFTEVQKDIYEILSTYNCYVKDDEKGHVNKPI